MVGAIKRVELRHRAKFRNRTAAEIWRFLYFFKIAAYRAARLVAKVRQEKEQLLMHGSLAQERASNGISFGSGRVTGLANVINRQTHKQIDHANPSIAINSPHLMQCT